MLSLKDFKEKKITSINHLKGGYEVIGKWVHGGITYEDREYSDGQIICYINVGAD